jgi:CRISPR/Cas system type I-B associated protein Csh2 (Cas7 group RAMP superfamily)
MTDRPTIEQQLLDMCESLLPKTTERNNQALKDLLKGLRKQMEAKNG